MCVLCGMIGLQVNTVRLEREDAGVNHAEGGWGASVDAADLQQTARYRRRVVSTPHTQAAHTCTSFV